jgi:hypothetical protein
MELGARSWSIAVLVLAALGGCDKPTVSSVKGGGGQSGGGAGGGSSDDGGAPAPGPDFVFPVGSDGGLADRAAVSTPLPGQACAQDVKSANLVPIDLLLLLDASGSMADKAGAKSRWELARDALASFVADPRSTGLGVGLQLFPFHPNCGSDGDCFLPSPGGCVVYSACLAPGALPASGQACGVPGAGDDPCPTGTTCTPLGRCSVSGGDCVGMGQPCPSGVPNDMCGPRQRQCRIGPPTRGSCRVPHYENPVVPIADLPGGAARLNGAIDTRLPIGGTPLAPALKGAINHLAARATSHPGRRAVLVIVSDGLPNGCGEIDGIVADLQAASARMPALSTYVVGVFADADPPEARTTMERFAVAGGTMTPFIISANEQLAEKFLAALSQIRGNALACDLAIPKPASGEIDFGKVNVRVNGSAGPVDLVYVERRERCDLAPNGGWYYDVDPKMGTPGRVHLCPGACDKVKGDPKGGIEVRFGCTSIIP